MLSYDLSHSVIRTVLLLIAVRVSLPPPIPHDSPGLPDHPYAYLGHQGRTPTCFPHALPPIALCLASCMPTFSRLPLSSCTQPGVRIICSLTMETQQISNIQTLWDSSHSPPRRIRYCPITSGSSDKSWISDSSVSNPS